MIEFEGGESLRFGEHSINEGRNGTIKVMNHLGMKDATVDTFESKI